MSKQQHHYHRHCQISIIDRQSTTVTFKNSVTKPNCNQKQLESESYDKLLMCNFASCYQSEGKAIVSSNISMMSTENCKQRSKKLLHYNKMLLYRHIKEYESGLTQTLLVAVIIAWIR
uniref:Uncharacterized protein n=1 Tax=Glossina pallidipes TaxID=7398 RepID=A0A1A9Z5C0_GLOPL